jgi:uncharacterized membrane protein YeaQ/YmgE (transglycosylase-associated protein family)
MTFFCSGLGPVSFFLFFSFGNIQSEMHMDIVSLIINLVSGAVGGNIAGAAMKDKNLGVLLNSVAGVLGGGAGAAVLKMLGMAVTDGGLDIQSVIASVASGGVGGAVMLVIAALVKGMMKKSA